MKCYRDFRGLVHDGVNWISNQTQTGDIVQMACGETLVCDEAWTIGEHRVAMVEDLPTCLKCIVERLTGRWRDKPIEGVVHGG